MTSALLVVVLTAMSVDLARRLALYKGRARGAWMWWAAFFGPLPLLVLGVLPARRHAA
jgi:hypothetical protein